MPILNNPKSLVIRLNLLRINISKLSLQHYLFGSLDFDEH